jgi:exopolysaccharide biosynthesis polyprenyl glycosylphosphotransferase
MNASLTQPRSITLEAGRLAAAAPSPTPRVYARHWRGIVMLGDAAALGVAFATAILLVWRLVGARPSIGACAVAALLLLAGFAAHDLHEKTYAILRRDEFYYALSVTLLTGLLVIPAFLLTDVTMRSRIAVAGGIVLAGLAIGAMRYLIRRTIGERRLFVEPRTVVVGDNGEAHSAAGRIEHDRRAHAQIVAAPKEHDAERWLADLCSDVAPTHIVIAEPLSGVHLNQLARAAARRGIVLAVAAESYARALAVRELVLGDATLLEVSVPRVGSVWARRAKRCFDVIVASLVLAAASPVLAVAACAIALEDGGSILYRQPRVGRDGRIFEIFKLRSMRIGAEAHTGPVWAVDGDARVTHVGRILRRTSIDELPQLLNVLRGEMSIVGPRPERPLFVERFSASNAQYVERLMVAPGLTACSHLYMPRNVESDAIGERLDYDLFYIRHWSLAMDVALLLKTAAEVAFHRAA